MRKYKVGETASVTKTISESDIYLFAGITGDLNPIHVNKVEAENSIFGQRIAHGILVTGFISTVIGMYLPGPGTIYMEQNSKFVKAVNMNDTITARITINKMLNEEKGILELETIVYNQDNDIVQKGTAIVKAPI